MNGVKEVQRALTDAMKRGVAARGGGVVGMMPGCPGG